MRGVWPAGGSFDEEDERFRPRVQPLSTVDAQLKRSKATFAMDSKAVEGKSSSTRMSHDFGSDYDKEPGLHGGQGRVRRMSQELLSELNNVLRGQSSTDGNLRFVFSIDKGRAEMKW